MVEKQLGFLQTGKNMFSHGSLAWYWFVENYNEARSTSKKHTAAGNSKQATGQLHDLFPTVVVTRMHLFIEMANISWSGMIN